MEGRFGNPALPRKREAHKRQRAETSDLDDVVGGVFVIRGHVQANQDALTVDVPHVRQRLQKAPLPRRPPVLPPEPVSHHGPPELGLFQRLQHRLGVQPLQYTWKGGGKRGGFTVHAITEQMGQMISEAHFRSCRSGRGSWLS